MRTKFLDYDARREPKTRHYCCMCQKDLRPDRPHRLVMLSPNMMVAHPDDYAGAPEFRVMVIGMDCARQLGMEWTLQADGAAHNPDGSQTRRA
jgi:hypothetical protein